MYAAYALSSIMSPTSSLMDMRAAGAIPALISVLNTSKVSLAALCWCSCTAQTVLHPPPEVDLMQTQGVGLLAPCGAACLKRWTWNVCQAPCP